MSVTGTPAERTHVIQQFHSYAQELYSFCHDRLGDPESAADATAAAFARNVASPGDSQEERLLLFRQVRRELSRFNVTSAPPVASDPGGSLIERVVRELRPHQREVILLSTAYGFDTPALARVLEVAPDTAGAMVAAAHRRFISAMNAALRSGHAGMDGTAIADEIAGERFGAVLARIPRPDPPADLFARMLAQMVDPPEVTATAPGITASATGITAKKLDLPTPSAEEPTPAPAEEAITEPMPKLIDRLPSPGPSGVPPFEALVPDSGPIGSVPDSGTIGSVPDSGEVVRESIGFIPGAPELPPLPVHADVLVASSTARPPEPSDRTDEFTAVSRSIVLPDEWSTRQEPPAEARTEGEVEPRAGVEANAGVEAEGRFDSDRRVDGEGEVTAAPRPTPESSEVAEAEPFDLPRVTPLSERRFDWLWELVGLLALAILSVLAMIYVPGWL